MRLCEHDPWASSNEMTLPETHSAETVEVRPFHRIWDIRRTGFENARPARGLARQRSHNVCAHAPSGPVQNVADAAC